MHRKCLLALAMALAAPAAAAYIGPGAGISFVGSLLTWVIGIFIALFAILFFPVRVLIRRLRRRPADPGDQEAKRPQEASAPTERGQ